MITTIGPDKSWRLVHDNVDVLLFIETSGYTTTEHTVFEAATEEECLAEIERLNLIKDPEPQPISLNTSSTKLWS